MSENQKISIKRKILCFGFVMFLAVSVLLSTIYVCNFASAAEINSNTNNASDVVAPQNQEVSNSEKPVPEATSVTGDSITLHWEAVENATRYSIATQNDDEETYYTYTYDCTDTTYTIGYLQEGKTYKCLVRAYVTHTWTDFTTEDLLPVTTKVTKPKPSATPSGDGKIKLKWDPIENAQKYCPLVYLDGQWNELAELDSSTISFEASDLANGHEHTFTVTAFIDGQWTSISSGNWVRATPVGTTKPTLETPAVFGTSLVLNWNHVPGAKKYAVSTREKGKPFVTQIYCTNEFATLTNLVDGVEYEILVQVYTWNKWNEYTSEDIVKIKFAEEKPQPVIVDTGDGYVNIKWDSVTGATKYAISEVVGSTYKEIDYNINKTSYVIDDLSNKVKHTFLVQAYINGRWTRFDSTNYISATPDGPVKPYNISHISGTNSIHLEWGRVSGAVAYAVSIKKSDGSYDIRTTSIAQPSKSSSTVTYTLTGLANSTQYKLLVQAFVNGRWSTYSETDLYSASTKNIKPVASAEATSNDGEIKVSWEPVDGATQYACSEYLGNGQFDIHIVGSSLQYLASDLVAQREHKFLVQAFVAGSWSSYTEADFIGASPTGSIKPTNIDTISGSTAIKLDWDKVPGATKYAVALRHTDKTYSLLSTAIPKSNNPTFTASGLKDSTEYTFLVQAFVDGSWSRYVEDDHIKASTISIKPQASAEATENDGEIKVSWQPVQNATQYACSEYLGDGKFDIHILGADLQYLASDLVAQSEHKFLVQAYVSGSWSSYTEADFVSATPKGPVKPTITSSSSSETTITINWNVVTGSDEYAASITTDEINWKICMVAKTKTTYTFTGLQPATTYKVLAQRRVDGTWSSYTSSDIVKVTTKESPSTTSTITFALDGGTTTSGKTTFSTDIGKTYSDFVFDTPYKSGYIFDYWSANGKGGAAINPTDTIPAKVTLTANYKQDKSASQYISDMGLTQTSFSNFYEIDFPDYDYTYALNRLKNATSIEDLALPEGFSCTSCRKGNFYGRNLDARALYETYGKEYVIHTPQTASKHATVGMSFSTLSDPTSTSQINNIKMLPFYLFDGINDAGLVCSTNALNSTDTGKNPGTDPNHQKSDNTGDLVSMMVVRYCLDYASSIDEAVKLLSTKNISAITLDSYSEFHMQIADATGKNAVIEFDWTDSTHTKKAMKVVYGGGGEFNNVCSNFLFLGFDGTEASMQPHGWGYERYKVINEALNGSSPAAMTSTTDMLNVMQKVYYSQMCKSEWFYDNSPDFWWSDYYGGSLSKNTAKTKANFQSKFDYYQQQISSGGSNYEKTLYSSAYNIANKTFSVRKGENAAMTLSFGMTR